ncbi:MAG: hypothetical protein M3Z25_11585 [Actinomycetota bacterium]|nr:hypothetical protein [Actinomycetota bacterium]
MRKKVWLPIVGVGVIVLAAAGWFGWQHFRNGSFTDQFPVARPELSPTGRSAYFVLEPGYQLTYAGGDGQVVATVLDQTEQIDGVTARVFEERETKAGALSELTRNYLAIDPETGDVYYLGEDVDEYSGGQVVGHGGGWRSGVAGARFGLLVPGMPRVGQRHFQEVAPGVAMDRAEVVSTTESVQVPAGTFTGAMAVDETSPLEPLATARKYYAPGIGMVKEDELVLVKSGRAG